MNWKKKGKEKIRKISWKSDLKKKIKIKIKNQKINSWKFWKLKIKKLKNVTIKNITNNTKKKQNK